MTLYLARCSVQIDEEPEKTEELDGLEGGLAQEQTEARAPVGAAEVKVAMVEQRQQEAEASNRAPIRKEQAQTAKENTKKKRKNNKRERGYAFRLTEQLSSQAQGSRFSLCFWDTGSNTTDSISGGAGNTGVGAVETRSVVLRVPPPPLSVAASGSFAQPRDPSQIQALPRTATLQHRRPAGAFRRV